jgi:hypothetical protein
MSLDNQKSTNAQPLRVFLCHSSKDKLVVRNLYQQLRAEGITPWLAEEDLLPGQRWEDEIPNAVHDTDVVLVCLSPGSVDQKGYVQKEIKLTLDIADEQPKGSIFVIPVRLEECEIPEPLKKWQWVNLFEEHGHERLMQALRYESERLGRVIIPVPRGTDTHAPSGGQSQDMQPVLEDAVNNTDATVTAIEPVNTRPISTASSLPAQNHQYRTQESTVKRGTSKVLPPVQEHRQHKWVDGVLLMTGVVPVVVLIVFFIFSSMSARFGPFTIDAKRDWQKIDVAIRQGDKVSIKCEGEWTLGKGQPGFPYTDANGVDVQDEWTRIPTVNTGSLIAKLGSHGDLFPIEECPGKFIAQADGPLFLSINDSNARNDNDGFIIVTLLVDKSPAPTPTPLPTSTTTINIDAREFWQKVPIPVHRGDEVEITCGPGQWTVDSRTLDWPYTDANGISEQGRYRRDESHLLPTANGGALIGRVGWTGEIRTVKCPSVFKVEADGPLLLIMNDSGGDVREDNYGVIPVTITVHRSP